MAGSSPAMTTAPPLLGDRPSPSSLLVGVDLMKSRIARLSDSRKALFRRQQPMRPGLEPDRLRAREPQGGRAMSDQGKHDQGKPVSVKGKVSDVEWRTRIDLAAAYRLVAAYGWDDLIFTHISARVPDSDHHFLINPYGMLFGEVTASNLVKIDLHGQKVMESPFDINPAGFVIHSAIHAAREDAACVMHLHTPAGVAV